MALASAAVTLDGTLSSWLSRDPFQPLVEPCNRGRDALNELDDVLELDVQGVTSAVISLLTACVSVCAWATKARQPARMRVIASCWPAIACC